MSGEGYVGVSTAGSTNVRTLTVTTYVDGVATDVRMQVLALADAEGRMVRLEDVMRAGAILDVLERIDQKLELLLATFS